MLRNKPLEVSNTDQLDNCPYCYRPNIYLSIPRSLWEELAAFFLLTPVRCPDCICCFYCSLLLAPILPGMSDPPQKTTQQEKASEDRWNCLKRRADIVKPEVSRFILYGILP